MSANDLGHVPVGCASLFNQFYCLFDHNVSNVPLITFEHFGTVRKRMKSSISGEVFKDLRLSIWPCSRVEHAVYNE